MKNAEHTLKFATFTISPSEGVNLVSVKDIHIKSYYVPVAMDVSPSGKVILVFRVLQCYGVKCYGVKSYKIKVLSSSLATRVYGEAFRVKANHGQRKLT